MKILLAIGGLTLASSAMSASFFDDFNRANSANLGANWVNATGSVGIVNNAAQAPSQSTNVALVNGYSDTVQNTTISFDVAHSSNTVAFAGAVLGHSSSSMSAFIKVQDNTSAGNFNRVFFYIGNNGAGGSLGFVDMTGFSSARIYVGFTGTVATLGVDSNFDTVIDQSYSADYGATGFGTGAGLTAFGDARIDNYAINPVPEPATMAALGLGVAALIRRKRSA